MRIGVQFYTLRDHCKTLEEFSESLKKVAEIGYKTVQISGVCEFEPECLNKELDKNGLECVITHWNYDEIKYEPLTAKKKHDIFGCKYIGLGSMPGGVNEENLQKFIKDYRRSAKTLAEHGSKLFYHNHHWEFSKCKDGKTILDKITEAFPANELGITLDTFWVQYGGADCVEVIKKLSGRVQCIHLKDMQIVNDEQRMAPVGHGNMNFKNIIEAAEKAGAEYLLVEQDKCYDEDPFECLKKSYDYLTSLGLN